MENLVTKYKELEKRVKDVTQDKPRLEAERDMLKREITKKVQELKDLGVEFEDREDLEKQYEELSENLRLSLDSLERKINEYEYVKKDLENIKNDDEEVIF